MPAVLSAFLTQASAELDKTFNSACGFSGTHEALREHSNKMVRDVGHIRTQAHELLKRSSMKSKHESKSKLTLKCFVFFVQAIQVAL